MHHFLISQKLWHIFVNIFSFVLLSCWMVMLKYVYITVAIAVKESAKVGGKGSIRGIDDLGMFFRSSDCLHSIMSILKFLL